MARTPTHKTFHSLIQYYISLYYYELQKIKTHPTLEDKVATAEHVELLYLAQLKNTEWDSEERQGVFRGEIEYLTSIFSKRDKKLGVAQAPRFPLQSPAKKPEDFRSNH